MEKPLRRAAAQVSDNFQVSTPDFLRHLQSSLTAAPEERLHATYSDRHGRYLDDEVLVIGAAGYVAVRARELFGRALALGAGGLLLAHNHPSGQCRPSAEDLAATDRMRAIARALDITLLDHLILTRTDIYSIRMGRCL